MEVNRIFIMIFNMRYWDLLHVNNKSLTIIDRRTGNLCLIGKWTYNHLRQYDNRVRLEEIPNPRNPHQVLTWIKIDKRG